MNLRFPARALLLSMALAIPAPIVAIGSTDAGTEAPDAGTEATDAGIGADSNRFSDADVGSAAGDATPPEVGPAGADSGDVGPGVVAAPDGSSPRAGASPPNDDGSGSGATGSGTDSGGPDIPVDRPKERLERAERAFREGDFSRIPPLLKPILEPESRLESESARIRARELLGVGLYFEAQQATDAKSRDDLMKQSRKQFLELLRERPDYELDSLIFPASVVEVFESVKEKHSEELAALRAENRREGSSNNAASSLGGQPLYIEREVRRNRFFWNLLPGAVGQFQNDQPVKGGLLAGGQLAAVGVHVVGFLRIQSLRQEQGTIPNITYNRENIPRIQQWRSAQYIAWAAFGGLYALSVVDAILNFQPLEVHIRTLDEPPPELSDDRSSGNGPALRIGLGGVQIRW